MAAAVPAPRVTSMLAVAQGETADATAALADAGIISLAIAIGVPLGLSVGRNALAVGRRVLQPQG